jgi:hypothetical protein
VSDNDPFLLREKDCCIWFMHGQQRPWGPKWKEAMYVDWARPWGPLLGLNPSPIINKA